MQLRWILPLCFAASIAYGETTFCENQELWASVDRINIVLKDSSFLDSSNLEELFQQAVELAASSEFSNQFEDLRMDAFETDDYTLPNEYVERAKPAITVLLLGESTNIGANPLSFLDRSSPGTEAFEFFQIAIDGFYIDGEMGRIGTAEFPVWMERFGSSAQALVNQENAAHYLDTWMSLGTRFDGYFLQIADETIRGLENDMLTNEALGTEN